MRPALLDLLLPPACAACGRFGSVLCAECQRSFTRPDPGDFVVADAGVVLGTALTLGLGAFVFTGPMRRALGRLKYAAAARAARPLAEAAAPALRRLTAVAGTTAVLVPAPLHVARQRQRGYNQAALLAAELARVTGLPTADILERHAATERMHHLDRAARLRNLRGAIRLRAGTGARPRTAIVVDDILTTSATLEACASVLLEGGAESVYGFAIAREV